ncbi:hypothetical protein O6P43_013476 [Quillaja saponaria]|uniref:Uncharacterized protein n=1 Tax=Quillaja saponaria TaxID=32244 RepID=A0AAD7LSI6_QUISA|nr:hypothetical protein O6P43_013476 [Quillaja saponaria]
MSERLKDMKGNKVYKRKKVIKPFKVFKRRKVKRMGVAVGSTNAYRHNEFTSTRVSESPSTKAADAIPDNEYNDMDVETNRLTCRNSLDAESEVTKDTEIKEATYVLNEDQKADIVSQIIFAHNAFFFNYLENELKKFIPNIDDNCDRFRQSYIKSCTKLVLSVFDVEYLGRSYFTDELEKQSTLLFKDFVELWENLPRSCTVDELEKESASFNKKVVELGSNLQGYTRVEETKQFDYLLHLHKEQMVSSDFLLLKLNVYDGKPFLWVMLGIIFVREKLITNPIINGIVEGKIDFRKYPMLREHDVGYILLKCVMEVDENRSHELCICPSSDMHTCAFMVPPEVLQIGKGDIKTVRDAVLNYKDLEDRMKNHLLMEFMNARCSGLMDTLLAETIRDMNIFELLNSLPPDSLEPNYNFDPNRDRTSGYILDGLYFLFLARFRGMEECSSEVELPLVRGWMGNFSEEVVEVVSSAADVQRRFDGQCFISVRHILLAVINRTDVDAVKRLVVIALLTCSSECAKLPPYDIYLSAWKLANKLGAAKVSIEQLAVAAVRKGAGLGIEMCYDVSSEESAVKFLNDSPMIRGKNRKLTLFSEYLGRSYFTDELEKQSTLLFKDFVELWENLPQSCTVDELEKESASFNKKVVELRSNLQGYTRVEETKQFDYLLHLHKKQMSSDMHTCAFMVPPEVQQIGKGDIKTVRDAVLNYKDLEDRMKNHLLMEFINARCSGLMDTLLAETIRDINIFELLNSLPPDSLEPNYNFDPNRDRTSGCILDGLYFLFLARFRGMEECSSEVELPLVRGWMGNFSEEVVEMVSSAADVQRRFDGQCFISVRHILLAVINRTDVDAVKQLVIIALLTCSSECAKLPPYDIYLSAWKLANKLGAESQY